MLLQKSIKRARLKVNKDLIKWKQDLYQKFILGNNTDVPRDVGMRMFDGNEDASQMKLDSSKGFIERKFNARNDIAMNRSDKNEDVSQRRSDSPRYAFQRMPIYSKDTTIQVSKDTLRRDLKDSPQRVFDITKNSTKRKFDISKDFATKRYDPLKKSSKRKFDSLKDFGKKKFDGNKKSTTSLQHHINNFKNNNNNNNNNNKKTSHKQIKQQQKQTILNKKSQKTSSPSSKQNKNISRKNITTWSATDETNLENVDDSTSNYGQHRDGYHGYHELPVPFSNANPYLHEDSRTTSPIFGNKVLTTTGASINEDVFETSIDHPSCHPTPCQLSSLPNHQNSVESLDENSFTDTGGDHFGNTMSNYDNNYAGTIDDGFGRVSDGALLSKSNEESRLLSQAKNLMRNSKLMAMQANVLENKAMLLDHQNLNNDIGVDGLLSQPAVNGNSFIHLLSKDY